MLVDQHALNQKSGAREDGPMFHVRGLTMFEMYQWVPTGFIFGSSFGSKKQVNVTAIMVVNSMPRLLTGSVLAHELFHAWLKLNNITELSNDVEEGMCQLMALLWLESQQLREGTFEKRAASYYCYKIRTDPTPVYGDGFRAAYETLQRLDGNLLSLVERICTTGRFM
eukprot:TRINITY_DN5277_c0_g1_i3.p2 TRINITY_DN5277_c0_g1~~TRINITY_DN5277_c0_g1_i3.p2  ORF type:complete len:168 (-),score=23.98 TRINITY_DN5277_c0_g1_i3:300-803(-)